VPCADSSPFTRPRLPPKAKIPNHEGIRLRFALDSPLEESGFEPSVPPRDRAVLSSSLAPQFGRVNLDDSNRAIRQAALPDSTLSRIIARLFGRALAIGSTVGRHAADDLSF
jgi:hypothetical protein